MSKEPKFNLDDFSYDISIPARMLFDSSLEANARILFAFVKGLTRAHGYCYATNAYLASLMDASERSIKYWLASLHLAGYLQIQTDKNGVHWQRRIYLSDGFKQSLRRATDCPPPCNPLPPPVQPVAPIYNRDIEIEDIKEESRSPSGSDAPPEFSQDVMELTDKLVESIKLGSPKAKIPDSLTKWREEIDRMIRIDKHTAEEIESVIRYLPYDSFWCKNILSATKLREHFAKLWGEMTKSPNAKKYQKNTEKHSGPRKNLGEALRERGID